MKNIIYYISFNQKTEEDLKKEEEKKSGGEKLCSCLEVWIKAQTLSENHTISLGNQQYAFPNKRFFAQKFEEITRQLIEYHLYAEKYCKTIQEYMKRRALWIYNHRTKVYLYFYCLLISILRSVSVLVSTNILFVSIC